MKAEEPNWPDYVKRFSKFGEEYVTELWRKDHDEWKSKQEK